MIDQSKPPLAELAHFGVKGMKWGIKKGYVSRQNAQGKAMVEAGRGEGTRAQRVATRVVTANTLTTNKALVKRGQKKIDHAARLKSGNATKTDVLKMYGGFTILDIKRNSPKVAKAPSNKEFGVRKGYVQRNRMQGNASLAVANPGNANLKTRLAYRQLSNAPFGTRSMHQKRGEIMTAHANRIADGKATRTDLVAMYARVSPFDIRRQTKGYGKRKG